MRPLKLNRYFPDRRIVPAWKPIASKLLRPKCQAPPCFGRNAKRRRFAAAHRRKGPNRGPVHREGHLSRLLRVRESGGRLCFAEALLRDEGIRRGVYPIRWRAAVLRGCVSQVGARGVGQPVLLGMPIRRPRGILLAYNAYGGAKRGVFAIA